MPLCRLPEALRLTLAVAVTQQSGPQFSRLLESPKTCFPDLESPCFGDIYKSDCLSRVSTNLETFRQDSNPGTVMMVLLSAAENSLILGSEHGSHVAIPERIDGDI